MGSEDKDSGEMDHDSEKGITYLKQLILIRTEKVSLWDFSLTAVSPFLWRDLQFVYFP